MPQLRGKNGGWVGECHCWCQVGDSQPQIMMYNHLVYSRETPHMKGHLICGARGHLIWEAQTPQSPYQSAPLTLDYLIIKEWTSSIDNNLQNWLSNFTDTVVFVWTGGWLLPALLIIDWHIIIHHINDKRLPNFNLPYDVMNIKQRRPQVSLDLIAYIIFGWVRKTDCIEVCCENLVFGWVIKL